MISFTGPRSALAELRPTFRSVVFGKQTYVESLIAGEVWPKDKNKRNCSVP